MLVTMDQSESRQEREERQAKEVERSQADLRDSIARTRNLLSQSDEMLQRHRRERDQAQDGPPD